MVAWPSSPWDARCLNNRTILQPETVLRVHLVLSAAPGAVALQVSADTDTALDALPEVYSDHLFEKKVVATVLSEKIAL